MSTNKLKSKHINTTQLMQEMPHGLVGEVVEYMNRTAIRKQPILAVAASLAFVGMVKGHRVQSETKIRTNFYAVGLGESGCGKDHPFKCIEAISTAAGITNHLLGDIISASGLLTGIKKAGGRALLNTEEIELVMAGLSSKKTTSRRRNILISYIKLYSSAGDDSCLSIFNLSTAEKFWASYRDGQVMDSFLNRLVVVESGERFPCMNSYPENYKNVPQSIIDKILAYDAMPTNVLREQGMKFGIINPRKVPCDEEAGVILDQFEDQVKIMYNHAFKLKDKTYPLWARVCEKAVKVALILQEGEFITAKDMKWACDFVYKSTLFTIKKIKVQIANNKRNRDHPEWQQKKKVIKTKNVVKRAVNHGK